MPATRYVRTPSGVHLAYQVVGEGPVDLVFYGPFATHVELLWEDPGARRFLEGLASFSRLVLFDKRGNGMSDPVAITDLPSLEERVEDLRAVLHAVGCECPFLFGCSEGGQSSALFAAGDPEACRGLVMYSSLAYSHFDPVRHPDGVADEAFASFLALVERDWGGPEMLRIVMPSVADDPVRARWWSQFFRRATSPGAALAQLRMNRETDVSDVLPSVRTPALVMHAREEQFIPARLGRRLAKLLPDARYVEMPGGDHLPFGDNAAAIVAEVREFVTGEPLGVQADRVLLTVLFTDIVDSTARAAAMGDQRWSDVLEEHHRLVRHQLQHYGGREIKTAGDGFLASFDGPANGVRCARAVIEAVSEIGLSLRAGLHTGECERRDGDLSGIAVHIGARVAAVAGPGEVLVSRTVKDLVAGSGLSFEDRGSYTLKGVPDEWHLFALNS